MVARMPHPTAPGRLPVHWSGSSDPAATTLVLLHGLTDSGECWPDAVGRWQGTYRIAAPDARGHGASPRYTADQLAADPIELMYRDTVDLVSEISGGGADPVGADRALDGRWHRGGRGGAPPRARARGGPGGPGLVRPGVVGGPARERGGTRGDLPGVPGRHRDGHGPRQGRERRLAGGRARPVGRAKADSDLGFLATGLAFLGTPWTAIAAGVTRAHARASPARTT